MTARVTTVVATRNRWPDLQRSLPRHDGPVVLVDNGSDDGTPDHVSREFPEVDVVRLSGNIGSVARNVGVERSRTAYVAFADDDSWWAPGALERAVGLFERHPRLALLAARILNGAAEDTDPTCDLMAGSPLGRDPDLPGPSVLGFVACGVVVRRDAYLAAGGFDPVVGFGGEEERLALDLATAGWGLAYVDEVVAHHHPSAVRDTDDARRARITRNELLTAMMRRPWPVVAGRLAAALRADAVSRRGAAQAIGRAHLALRDRRPVPGHVESRVRLLGH